MFSRLLVKDELGGFCQGFTGIVGAVGRVLLWTVFGEVTEVVRGVRYDRLMGSTRSGINF